MSDSVGTSQNASPHNPRHGYDSSNNNTNPDDSTKQRSLKGAETNNTIYQGSGAAQGVAGAQKNGSQVDMAIIDEENCAIGENTHQAPGTTLGSEDTGSGSLRCQDRFARRNSMAEETAVQQVV